jgi:hypothetical protein
MFDSSFEPAVEDGQDLTVGRWCASDIEQFILIRIKAGALL